MRVLNPLQLLLIALLSLVTTTTTTIVYHLQFVESQQTSQTISCYFSADNYVIKVYVNGVDLTRNVYEAGTIGFNPDVLRDLNKAKYVEFDEPATEESSIAFMLADEENARPSWSGFIMTCLASQNRGPWHRLVSSLDTSIWSAFSSRTDGEVAKPNKITQNIYNAFPIGWYTLSVPGTAALTRSSSGFQCNYRHCQGGMLNDISPNPQRIWTSDDSVDNLSNYAYVGLRAKVVRPKSYGQWCKQSNIDAFVADYKKNDYCAKNPSKDMCNGGQYSNSILTANYEYSGCFERADDVVPECSTYTSTASLYPRVNTPEKCSCMGSTDNDDYYDLLNPACKDTSRLVSYMYCESWEYDEDDDQEYQYRINMDQVLFWNLDLGRMRCEDDDHCRGEFCPGFGQFNDPEVIYNTSPWDQCAKKCPFGYYCNQDKIGKCAAGSVCDKKLCNGNFYCEVGNVPRQCTPGCYCPLNDEIKLTVELNCGAGNYCPAGSKVPIVCPVGNYCYGDNTGAPVTCQKGNYCLRQGLAVPLFCPPGYYCPVGASSMPLSCTKDQSCGAVYSATTTSKCNNGNDCDKFLFPYPIKQLDIRSMWIHDTQSTIKTVFSGVYKLYDNYSIITPNQFIIQGDSLGSMFSPMYYYSSSSSMRYLAGTGRLVLRNVNFLVGKIELNEYAVLVLENSSINIKNIQFAAINPDYAPIIVLRGSSHLMGLGTKLDANGILRYDVPEKVKIEFDGSDAANSVIGCDSMPSCDAAPFLITDKVDPWRNVINDLVADTTSSAATMKKYTSVGSSQERRKMVIKSLLQCAAQKEGIHDPSTYISRALYCATQDKSTQFNSADTYKEVPTVVDFVLSSYTLDSDETKLLVQIKQIAIERQNLNGLVVSGGNPVAPRVSLDFLIASKGPKRGTVDYLLDSYDQINEKISTLSSTLLDFVGNLKTMQSKDLKDRLRQYSIAKAQAETGKLVAQAQLDAANTAITILINRGKNAFVLADALTKRLVPTLQAARKQIEALLETSWLDCIVAVGTAIFKLATAAIAIMENDIESGLGNALEGIIGYGSFLKEMHDKKEKDYKDLTTNESIKYVGQIFDALGGAISEVNSMEVDLKQRVNDQKVGFNLPKSRWLVIADNIVKEIMGAGCGEYTQSEAPACYEFKDLVYRISDIQMELSDITNSMVDLIQTRDIAKLQVERYDQLVKGWSEKYITEEYNQELTGLGFLAEVGGQMADAQRVLQGSLSRIQIYALTMIRNGIQALDTLCRAAAYYNPNNYNSANWQGYCVPKISSKITISDIQSRVEAFLNDFGEMPDPQNWQDTSLEITKLINLKKFRDDIKNAGANSNPNITFTLTPNMIPNTNILSCTENIAAQWVGFYLTSKSTGKLSIPDPTSIQIRLNGPFIKRAKTQDYLFDFKEKLYDIAYNPGDTINTLYEPSPSDLLDTFARPSPFAKFTILRRGGLLFDDSSDFRAWLLIKYTGTAIPNCNTAVDCTLLSKTVCSTTSGCVWNGNNCDFFSTKSPVEFSTKSPTSKPSFKPTKGKPTKKPVAGAPSSKPTKTPVDRPVRSTKSPTIKPTSKAPDVVCQFTADNYINEVWVNGVDLTSKVTGDLTKWESVKTISFYVTNKFPQVIAIKASEYDLTGGPDKSGLKLKCTSKAYPSWNFTSKPGTGWIGYSSATLTFPKGWNLGSPIAGEISVVQSTSPFDLVGVTMDANDKIWISDYQKYAGFKKIIGSAS